MKLSVTPSDREVAARRPTVLIVEDDPHLREMVALVLRDAGYAVLEAGDGLQAIGIIERHQPPAEPLALILLDLMLPRVNGLQFMATLAEHLGDVPIVAMSGNPDYLARAPAQGARAVLSKPFELKTLTALVARFARPNG
jgi:CheY-like chemotaxis protein